MKAALAGGSEQRVQIQSQHFQGETQNQTLVPFSFELVIFCPLEKERAMSSLMSLLVWLTCGLPEADPWQGCNCPRVLSSFTNTRVQGAHKPSSEGVNQDFLWPTPVERKESFLGL